MSSSYCLTLNSDFITLIHCFLIIILIPNHSQHSQDHEDHSRNHSSTLMKIDCPPMVLISHTKSPILSQIRLQKNCSSIIKVLFAIVISSYSTLCCFNPTSSQLAGPVNF